MRGIKLCLCYPKGRVNSHTWQLVRHDKFLRDARRVQYRPNNHQGPQQCLDWDKTLRSSSIDLSVNLDFCCVLPLDWLIAAMDTLIVGSDSVPDTGNMSSCFSSGEIFLLLSFECCLLGLAWHPHQLQEETKPHHLWLMNGATNVREYSLKDTKQEEPTSEKLQLNYLACILIL